MIGKVAAVVLSRISRGTPTQISTEAIKPMIMVSPVVTGEFSLV